jgi:hypothetical protein
MTGGRGKPRPSFFVKGSLAPVDSRRVSTQTQNGIEAFRRRARTEDGHELVFLRCLQLGARWIVECEVRPRSAPDETVRLGPYAFVTERAARAFADEATLALEYLGCEIS